jgi:peptidyl-prolyl cis-trans isomerase C
MSQRIVVAIALAVLVSGCQKKASGQALAVVNNEEITSSDLNAELAAQNASTTGTTKEARAQAVQNLINRRLLAQQAKSDGLDKSPEFLSQQRRMTEDLLINMLVTRQANTSKVPSADEIAKFEASHPGMFAKREIWTLQQIQYPLPKDAAITAKIGATKSLEQIAQILTASGIQFTRNTRQFDSAMLPPNLYPQIDNLPPGEPFVAPGPDKAVASIISARQPAPLTPDQARQLALSQLRREQVNKLVGDRLKELKAKAKIEYQPGFAPAKK